MRDVRAASIGSGTLTVYIIKDNDWQEATCELAVRNELRYQQILAVSLLQV